MKDPWIAIADLMSGFVVVLLLMVVSAVARPRLEAQARARVEATSEAGVARRRDAAMQALSDAVGEEQRAGLLSVSVPDRLIELRDLSFASGTACLSDEASAAVLKLGDQIGRMMNADEHLHIFIEGHTDPTPVSRLINRCGWFANNTQLSAQRAANVRDVVVAAGHLDSQQRLPVTGWGPDRLRNREDPQSAVNRRVELRFQWLDVEPEEKAPTP